MNGRQAAVGLLFAAVVGALGVAGCSRAPSVWTENKPVRVVVTIPPLESFVRNVAGSHAEVKCLCTVKGPHDYDYDVNDTLAFRDANVFFAVGLLLDNKFADKLAPSARQPNFRYVKLGERLPKDLLLKSEEHDEDEKEHGKHDKDEHGKEKDAHGHGHEHEHGEYDPHVWLGIPQALAMVDQIRDNLKELDAAHADEYDANAKKYRETLEQLRKDGREMLKAKKNKRVISFHESLAYFAKSFDVDVVASMESSPGDEPDAGTLANLVKLCKEKDVRVIAIEPQYQSKGSSAEKLKQEVKGMELVEVDPLETAKDAKELSHPEWYQSKMRENVNTLAKALP
jgi:ABC-type Zn uptake system ZnuABC Zn-binding protein ZnuA